MANIEDLETRITELESTLMHFQKDYDSLNAVVLENAQRLEKAALLIQQLTNRVDSSTEGQAARNPEDEKPPHY
ncbi:MAG: SlyX family protein [Mariniblastus sp.]|nr:SlyX family protein [Mariniblastus sp.]